MKNWIFGFTIGLLAASSPLASAQNSANAAPAAAATPTAVSGSATPTTTEITADEQTTFVQKTNTAIFRGNVKVTNPRFNLTCDQLIAVLKGTSTKPAATASPTPSSPATNPLEKQKPDDASANHQVQDGDPASGIDHGTAIGHVVIIQNKQDKDGKTTQYIGKAQRAEFDSKTGNIELTGWPSVQQGANLQVATAESTTMVMNQNTGAMKTNGPSKTVIVQENGAKQ